MDEDTTPESRRRGGLLRRTVLRAAAAGGAAVGATGVGASAPGRGRGRDDQSGRGHGRGRGNQDDGENGRGRDDEERAAFPPAGTTTYGRAVDLGNGQVRPFTTETPSGEPKYHGVEFERAALEGLPGASTLADADNKAETDKYRAGGQAAQIHFKWSQQYFLPFPDAAATPFTFLGLNWNPEGHYGGQGAWLRPHFDVHFHMLDPAAIDVVEGPQLPPYDTGSGYTGGSPAPDPDATVEETGFPSDQLPAGYTRPPEPVADQRYITDMGEHTAPVDAPEIPGNPDAFTNTLIQGFVGGPGVPEPRLAFVEPMLTREYLRGLDGVETFDVAQPDEYPHDLRHPRQYSVRDVPANDTVVVALQAFEQV